ncbi:glycosyl transferase [candidate division KSB1 bacterium]|nr:glycosyl transferase [candidate division KSB1 bacterium]
MGDFYQHGVVATLHRLGRQKLEELEKKLMKLSERRAIVLILPIIPRDLEAEPFMKIVEELRGANYLHEIVIALGRTTQKEHFIEAKKKVSDLPQKVTILWTSGSRLDDLYHLLKINHLEVGPDGKGRSTWVAYGYVLSKDECGIIVQHDCDIVNYNRELLARLCYPLVNQDLDFKFCKGYYPRVTDRFYGRVTRLFVTPLIRSLMKMVGYHPFLVYLDNFRYPLSGEFSMTVDLARTNRVPGDWGLEIGTLAEIYRNCHLKRVCQVDLADTYEHKHQPLSNHDPSKGLMKMSIDIGKVFFRTLSSEGVIFTDEFFKNLTAAFLRTAQDTLKQYEADAAINGLYFDRHQEGQAVETFTRSIQFASEEFLKDPLGVPQIPNWSRVISAIPEILYLLADAVEEDSRKIRA